MSEFYCCEKTIGGRVYVARYAGLAAAGRMEAESLDENGRYSPSRAAAYVFARVIVSPQGLCMDDFDSLEELGEVLAFARGVALGRHGLSQSRQQRQALVKQNMAAWRLLFAEVGFDYNTVFHQMLPEEIALANTALDIRQEAMKKRKK